MGWFTVKDPIEGRCHVVVMSDFHSSQCSRKAVVDGKWCKQHSPAAEEARAAKREADYQVYKENSFRKYRGGRIASILEKAIEDIAGGHNDPRARALQAQQEVAESDKKARR